MPTPTINGKEYRFADIKVSLFGQKLTGLRGIDYKRKRNKELLHAQGDEPFSVQSGNADYSGSITMLKADFDALNTAAVAAGYTDITDLPGFPIVVEYSNAAKISIDTLVGVEFDEYDEGLKQGDKFKEVTLPILYLRIKKA